MPVNIPFPRRPVHHATCYASEEQPGAGPKYYVEFSNELWNTWGPFRAMPITMRPSRRSKPIPLLRSITMASILSRWQRLAWQNRRMALRTVQVSNIFRQAGDSAMMSRVRPVMMSARLHSRLLGVAN